ncbi:MAG: Mur ligase, partial [Opitutaceae bacterium]
PRSNTARTRIHQAGFIEAFALADRVYLGAISRTHHLSPGERLDIPEIIQTLGSQNVPAATAESNLELLETLLASHPASPNHQVMVFFTNGSFDGIIEKFVAVSTR